MLEAAQHRVLYINNLLFLSTLDSNIRRALFLSEYLSDLRYAALHLHSPSWPYPHGSIGDGSQRAVVLYFAE